MKKNSDSGRRWIYFKNGNLSNLYLYTTDNYSENYIDGNADKEMMDSILKRNANGKVIFDVGAFIGADSLVFAKLVGKKGRVISFEPNPYNLCRIEKNLQKNINYVNNIKVFPLALSDNNKKTKMLLSKEIDNGYSSTSRLEGSHSTIHNSDLPDGFEMVEVEVKKLDTFVNEEKILPDIIKVDIEGAEYNFLLGSIETVRKLHPTFYIEFHSEYCATKCTEFLVLEGYSIKVLHEEDDNRIMVLAEYVNESNIGANVKNMKKNDTYFSIIKNMSDSMLILNNENKNKNKIIKELIEENNNHITQKERSDITESINRDLLKKIENIESSQSWRITKPLRKITHIVRKIIKNNVNSF